MSVIILSDLVARKKALVLKAQLEVQAPLDEASQREFRFMLEWFNENPLRVLRTENVAVADYFKASGFIVNQHPDSTTVVGKSYTMAVPDEMPTTKRG
jgi:hypothetical protein